MLVSTRGRYALRVLIELAEAPEGEFLPLQTIADKQDISEKYLESIISLLVKNYLVKGHRGKGGGYQLTKSADEYTIGEILKITEGTLAPVTCLDDVPNKCPRVKECRTISMWENLNTIISNYLYSVKLSDLINPSELGDYQI